MNEEESAAGAGTFDIVQPVVISRGEHCISRRDIDPDALKVLYRLARNNHTAYLVGGGVRDLLLGRKPKDFDVSTDARPEQIRALFRNCILIGRRFRLAHVRYGEKIIETSTFRSTPKCPTDPADPEADLFQRDDNMFGSPQEDAFRRDFTVNGLFYDIESFSIIDYVGGMKDLEERRIRCIGDPNIRFREDPVRMLRAVRFASRLNFALDAETEDAIRRHGEELTKASPARLLEEITRLFAFSSGERAVRLLASTGLLRVILPEVSAFLDSEKFHHEIFWARLRALDNGDTVLPEGSPALVFAVLFLDALKANLQRDWTFDTTPKLRFDKAHAFLDPLSVRLRFPRKLVDRIVHMYINQSRFSARDDRGGKKGGLANFVTQESFHESLALAEIVLSSENGDETRLNMWRDLLAERIFGRDDGQPDRQYFNHDRDHRGGRHGRHGRNGNGNDRGADEQFSHDDDDAPEALEAPEPQVEANAAPAQDDGEMHGHKMSRSARRRRNKRLRRLQGNEDGQNQTDRPETRGAVFEAAPAPEPQPQPEKPRRTRGKTKDAAETPPEPQTAEAPAVAAEAPAKRGRGKAASKQSKPEAAAAPAPAPVIDAEPPKPLTAAAFWADPEPESEPKPEKKKRDSKKKAPSKSKTKEKDPAAEKSADPLERKPLAMDKADEADIPIDWLDEI